MINWLQFLQANRPKRSTKPVYPNASAQIARNARALLKARAKVKDNVIEMKVAK